MDVSGFGFRIWKLDLLGKTCTVALSTLLSITLFPLGRPAPYPQHPRSSSTLQRGGRLESAKWDYGTTGKCPSRGFQERLRLCMYFRQKFTYRSNRTNENAFLEWAGIVSIWDNRPVQIRTWFPQSRRPDALCELANFALGACPAKTRGLAFLEAWFQAFASCAVNG